MRIIDALKDIRSVAESPYLVRDKIDRLIAEIESADRQEECIHEAFIRHLVESE